jgi:cob(I)alamin adenosyltransferase
MLTQLQRELFSVCSDLCVPEADRTARVEAGWVTRLEQWIDELSAAAPPVRYFVLPGGAAGAAYLHLARTVCRRAEREVVTLARAEPVGPAVLPYLNRLSDLLFSLAHYEIHQAGGQELLWQAGATGADTKGSH